MQCSFDFLNPHYNTTTARPRSMATTMAATRAVARAATTYIPHSAAKGAKGRASLIYEMHSKLYPDLYNASGQPKKPLLSTHNKTPSAEGEQVYVPSKAKGQQAPNIFNSLKEFQKEYKDARLEKAGAYPLLPQLRISSIAH